MKGLENKIAYMDLLADQKKKKEKAYLDLINFRNL